MKRTILLAIGLALIVVTVTGVAVFAQGPSGGPAFGPGWMMGGGMMGGRPGFGPGQVITPTTPFGYGGMGGMMGRGFGMGQGGTYTGTMPFGSGMMGPRGVYSSTTRWGMHGTYTSTMPFGGMMGGGRMGRGFGMGPGGVYSGTLPFGGPMMGGWGRGAITTTNPITLSGATALMKQYVAAQNNSDLKLVEVEEWQYNFYGVVQEMSTGTNAFQVVVWKANGAVMPEMGPNMMWNTKYGHMVANAAPAKMTVSPEQARKNAADWVQANLPNTTVKDKADTFYGYYNVDVLQGGKTYGMLSVNGFTGEVWFHNWHGAFVSMQELP